MLLIPDWLGLTGRVFSHSVFKLIFKSIKNIFFKTNSVYKNFCSYKF